MFFKKIIFILAFLLFLSPTLVKATETQVIKITNNGFEPQSLQIEKGTKVRFENTDSVEHWPASDIHPTHSVYAEFDPKAAISPGDSWEFTFEKPGSWSIHDHLRPEFVGTIIVSGEHVEESQPLFQKIKERVEIFILKHFKNYREAEFEKVDMYELANYKSKLKVWTAVAGPQALIEKLLVQSDGGSSRDCHKEAHILGHAAYEVVGREAFSMDGAHCHSGFYHGAMEGLLSKEGIDNLSEKIKTICDNFKTSFSQFECLHGVGHGVLAFAHYDLPHALEYCKLLADQFSRDSCYGGVFMENIVAAQGSGANSAHNTKWVSSDSHFPCNALDQEDSLQFQCYQMQTSWMMSLFGGDYEKISDECLNASPMMVPVCYKSLGRDIAGSTLRDPDKIIDSCQFANDFFDRCIEGALNVIIDFWGNKMESYPHELCKKLNEQNKLFCYKTLASRIQGIYGDDQAAIDKSCNAIEKDYIEACKYIQ